MEWYSHMLGITEYDNFPFSLGFAFLLRLRYLASGERTKKIGIKILRRFFVFFSIKHTQNPFLLSLYIWNAIWTIFRAAVLRREQKNSNKLWKLAHLTTFSFFFPSKHNCWSFEVFLLQNSPSKSSIFVFFRKSSRLESIFILFMMHFPSFSFGKEFSVVRGWCQ